MNIENARILTYAEIEINHAYPFMHPFAGTEYWALDYDIDLTEDFDRSKENGYWERNFIYALLIIESIESESE